MREKELCIAVVVNDERGVPVAVIAGKLRYYERLEKTWCHARPLLRLTESWKKCITIRRFLLFTAIGHRGPFSPPRLSPLLFSCSRASRRFIMPFVRAHGFYRLFNIYRWRTGAILISSGCARHSISCVNSESSSRLRKPCLRSLSVIQLSIFM